MDDATRQLYSERGLGGATGRRSWPALVIVDLNRGFTDPASPLHCDTEAAVEATARLLEARASTVARSQRFSTTKRADAWPRHAKYGDVVSTDEALELLRAATFAEAATVGAG